MQTNELVPGWDGAWQVDGRPITNCEMYALRQYAVRKREELGAAKECGDCIGPWDDGLCRFGIGRCVFVKDAEKLIWRHEHDGEDND